MAQQPVTQGLNWGQIRAILNNNSNDVETRLAQIETGGVQIISGAGAPAANAGNVGDYYIDSTGYLIYGPKTNAGWPQPVSMSGFVSRGMWESATSYTTNDVVTYENSVWAALGNNTNDEPRDLSTNWIILARGVYFRGAWVSGTQYRLGHQVRYEGSIYRSNNVEFTSTVAPDVDTGNWEMYVSKGDTGEQGIQGVQGDTGARGLNHTGNYSAVTVYAVDDSAVYRSKLWRRKTVGSGVEPTTDNTTEWEKIAGSLHYITSVWGQGNTYRTDDIVKHDGDAYRVRTNHVSTATVPNADAENYELFLAKGEQGLQGLPGAVGEQGEPGVPGTPGAGLAPGFIAPFAGNVVPDGWLDCDGQPVSRTTYANLFSIIGTLWGVGDGSTTFNLPDFRGKVLVDDGTGGGLTARVLAAEGGTERHVLTLSEIPTHSHQVSWQFFGNSTAAGGGDRTTRVGSGASSATTTSVGGNGAHNNMQPFSVVKYLIKV